MSLIKVALLSIAKPFLKQIATKAKENLKRDCEIFTIEISKDKSIVNFEGDQMNVDVSEHWNKMIEIALGLLDADEIIGFALVYNKKPILFSTYYLKNNQKLSKAITL